MVANPASSRATTESDAPHTHHQQHAHHQPSTQPSHQHTQSADALSSANGSSQHTKQTGFPQLSRKFVARRISEGETGRLKEELKCQACGKGYKHVSSLAKHLWEHTPEWNVTSKLLISKHQQVQLLEAASILVSMNDEDNNEDEEESEGGVANTPETTADSSSGDSNNSSRESSKEPAKLKEPVGEDDIVKSLRKTSKQELESIDGESAIDMGELTPARDIPILSAKPISKTPSRHSHRRSSINAGSLGSSLTSLSRADNLMLRQASPLPESILAKDQAHHPPYRRRRQSTLYATSIPRESSLELDEDGLQDPHESPDNDAPHTPKQSPKHSPKRSNAGNDDVFGLEV